MVYSWFRGLIEMTEAKPGKKSAGPVLLRVGSSSAQVQKQQASGLAWFNTTLFTDVVLVDPSSDPDDVGVGVSDVSDPALRRAGLDRSQAQETDQQSGGGQLGQLEGQSNRTEL